jgi:Phage tail assembly chaperone proteins, E, or 41 or 14
MAEDAQAATAEFNPFPQVPDEAPKPAHQVRWLTDKKRVESIPLDYPIEIDGTEYRVVEVRRLTAGEVAAFVAKMRGSSDVVPRFPMFFDERGGPLPSAFWDVVDDDDLFALDQASQDFLPARFRAAQTVTPVPGSAPETGATSGSSSAT